MLRCRGLVAWPEPSKASCDGAVSEAPHVEEICIALQVIVQLGVRIAPLWHRCQGVIAFLQRLRETSLMEIANLHHIHGC